MTTICASHFRPIDSIWPSFGDSRADPTSIFGRILPPNTRSTLASIYFRPDVANATHRRHCIDHFGLAWLLCPSWDRPGAPPTRWPIHWHRRPNCRRAMRPTVRWSRATLRIHSRVPPCNTVFDSSVTNATAPPTPLPTSPRILLRTSHSLFEEIWKKYSIDSRALVNCRRERGRTVSVFQQMHSNIEWRNRRGNVIAFAQFIFQWIFVDFARARAWRNSQIDLFVRQIGVQKLKIIHHCQRFVASDALFGRQSHRKFIIRCGRHARIRRPITKFAGNNFRFFFLQIEWKRSTFVTTKLIRRNLSFDTHFQRAQRNGCVAHVQTEATFVCHFAEFNSNYVRLIF